MPEILGEFPRAWVEFPDPSDADQIIRADLTWLTSRWQCIYNNGCPSIDAAVPHGGCCTFGAHFADDDDEARTRRYVQQLTAEQWELAPNVALSDADWITTDADGERKTPVVDGACVFLNGPDFGRGPGCALHVLAQDLGVSHVQTKPEVCWQLPIRRDFEQRARADGTEKTAVVITEYVRGMWGEGGHDLDWYCSANTEAHTATEPVYRHSESELTELLGASAYHKLVEFCEAHEVAQNQLTLIDISHSSLTRHPADPTSLR
jgi:hypothetical protein